MTDAMSKNIFVWLGISFLKNLCTGIELSRIFREVEWWKNVTIVMKD